MAATISGTALVPGVSANRRAYRHDVIGRAVRRMQERIADPQGKPITMLSHHGAGDDSTRIVGRVTKVWQDSSGAARFEAVLAETVAGRDIATLVTAQPAFLRSTSIRGWWLGPTTQVAVNGVQCETADDLEVDGIDFTASPGVAAALISSATAAEAQRPRNVITETALEVHMTDSIDPHRETERLAAMTNEEFAKVAEAEWASRSPLRAARGRSPFMRGLAAEVLRQQEQ